MNLRGCSVVVLALAGACGGGSSSAPKPTPEPEPLQRTRIPIEEPEEDTPEDGVQVISTRGRMDPSTIEAGIEPHKQALSDCYMSRVGRKRWLGGRVSLKWDVDKAGAITKVVLAESDLGAWQIEKCLLEVARSASFGKPIGGAADFSIPLDFSAKGRLLTWDEDQALRAVGGQVALLDACVHPDTAGHKPGARKRKKKNGGPSANGGKRVPLPDDVTVTLYAGPGGKAQSVGFSSPNPIDDAWADCAEKIAMSWRLTDPRGVIAKLAVRYRN